MAFPDTFRHFYKPREYAAFPSVCCEGGVSAKEISDFLFDEGAEPILHWRKRIMTIFDAEGQPLKYWIAIERVDGGFAMMNSDNGHWSVSADGASGPWYHGTTPIGDYWAETDEYQYWGPLEVARFLDERTPVQMPLSA